MLYIGKKAIFRFLLPFLIILGSVLFASFPVFGLASLGGAELLEAKKYVHEPYKNYQCDSCHIGTPGKKLKKPVSELCFDCHSSMRLELENRFAHSPFGQGDCMECHEAHQSDHNHLLSKSPDSLCEECHSETRGKSSSKHRDAIRKLGNKEYCLTCHQTHSGDNPSLLSQDALDLCLSCHDDHSGSGENNHPVGEGQLDPRTGSDLTCTSTCHKLHGTSSESMLRIEGDGLCLSCHDVSQLP